MKKENSGECPGILSPLALNSSPDPFSPDKPERRGIRE